MNPDLVTLFKPFLSNPVFKETLSLVRQNSEGKIWLIGGYLYKNLASALYGSNPYEYDIDFIVEHKNQTLKEVPGWNIQLNSYGNPNYTNHTHNMSFTDIHKAIRVFEMERPTIEEFIKHTPLTIQSIAYDIHEEKIIGERGIHALLMKEVAINHTPQAQFYAQMKNKTLEQIILEKTKELNF